MTSKLCSRLSCFCHYSPWIFYLKVWNFCYDNFNCHGLRIEEDVGLGSYVMRVEYRWLFVLQLPRDKCSLLPHRHFWISSKRIVTPQGIISGSGFAFLNLDYYYYYYYWVVLSSRNVANTNCYEFKNRQSN